MRDLPTDPLTGAYTRAVLPVRLQQELGQGVRAGGSFALLMLDLDYFKSINDAFGHARGDEALTELVRRVRESVRHTDEVYRYGGDEFVILLPQTAIAQAAVLAERMLAMVRGEPLPGEPPVTLSVSIGVSSFPEDGDSIEALFDAMDRRHYQSKAAGRGRVTWRDDLSSSGEAKPVAPERLIERDEPLRKLRQFLGMLPEQQRGVCYLHGPAGVGVSRMLAETRKLARLMGYAVLSLAGQPALRARQAGALIEAQQSWPDWPVVFSEPEALAVALRQRLADKGLRGLLITVDQLDQLDHVSLTAVVALLGQTGFGAVGLVYSARQGTALPALSDASLQQQIVLQPLSPTAVQIWLRQSLHWEAPATFVDWLYEHSSGLAAVLAHTLAGLVAAGALRAVAGGWLLRPNYQQHEAASVLVPATNLPADLPGFVGRAEEMRTLKRLVQQHQLITLVGPGGSGKSRLALQVAAESRAEFADGVFLVTLGAVPAFDLVGPAIGEALGVRFSNAGSISEQLVACLRTRQLLLVLDAFEHLLDSAPLLATLVAQAPGVRLLITSLARLNLFGEVAVELQGLLTAEEGSADEDAQQGEALALFLHAAGQSRPGFAPVPAERRWAARICRLVNGMPLGIELAAAWVASFTCEEIAGEIARNLAFLSTEHAALPARHRSMSAVFDAGWNILTPFEQQTIARLAVFQGGFTRNAGRQVAAMSPLLLDALVAKLFLHVTPGQRYTMHALLHQYVAAKLAATSDLQEQTQARHATYYLELLRQQVALFQPASQRAALDALVPELANLRAAWQYAVQQAEYVALYETVASLTALLTNRGWFQEGQSLLERAVEQLAIAPTTADWRRCQARLLTQLGQFHYHLGSYSKGCERLEQALMLLDPHEEARATAEALSQVANSRMAQGHYAEANAALQRALALIEGHDEPNLTFWLVSRMGVVAWLEHDYERARPMMERALQLARARGEPGKLAVSLCNLGELTFAQGEYAQADATLREALALSQQTGVQALQGSILDTLARNAAGWGDAEAAARYFVAGLGIVQAIDAAPLACELLVGVAEFWAAQGQQELAHALAAAVAQQSSARADIRQRATLLCTQLAGAAAPPDLRWHEMTLAELCGAVIGLLPAPS